MTSSRREFLAALALAGRDPNFVLILADDLGYGDLGCFGAVDSVTPNLDRLAQDGARLTNHYTGSPVCSPARASLMTGLIPDRTGVTGVLRDDDDDTGLDLRLPTIASLLRDKGYTTALIGKWHLGMKGAYLPRKRGFDYFWGFLNGTIDYFTHLSKGGGATGQRTTYENEQPVELKGYFPDLATAKAVQFVESHAPRKWFLYLPLALPHTPLQAAPRWKKDESNAEYRGMLRSLDNTIGELRAALERTKQWDRTVVIFLSDHGWVKKRAPAEAGSNGALRGGKYELYEGGIRVPCIVRWPGLTKPGSTIHTPCWFPDWLPTLAGKHTQDGVDIKNVLRGSTRADREFYWRFEDSAVKTPLSFAIRYGKWKLLKVGTEKWLFDLEQDPAEQRDLSMRQPAIVADLERRLAARF
ncbi:MAG: sulfatase-like hydrolase/transferase [Bryobacteraceae bacterium]